MTPVCVPTTAAHGRASRRRSTVPVIRKAAAAVRAARAATPDGLVPPEAWRTLGQSVPNVTGRAIVTGAQGVSLRSTHARPSACRGGTQPAPQGHAEDVRCERGRAAAGRARVARRRPARRSRWRHGDGAARSGARHRRVGAGHADAAGRVGGALQEDGGRAGRTAPRPLPATARRGDVVAGLAGAVARQSSVYQVAPIAHVPLEPRAAIAEWNDDGVTVHSGVQAPFLCRQEVAKALEVPEARVRIVATDSGGAYGGKQRGECEVEAARLSRLAGTPVRVAWTREEEFTCSYTRPAGLLEVESGVDASGRLVAMRFANYNSGAAGLDPAVRHRAPLGRLLPHAVRRPSGQLSIARGGGEQLRARVAHGRMGRDAEARSGRVPPAQHHGCAAARGDRTDGRTFRLAGSDAAARTHARARRPARDAASA